MLCRFTSSKTVNLVCQDGSLPVFGYGTGLSFLSQCDADNQAYNQAYNQANVLRLANPCSKITPLPTGTSLLNSFVMDNSISNDFVNDINFSPDGLIDDRWIINITFPDNGGILEKIRITKNNNGNTPQYAWATVNPPFFNFESYTNFLPLTVFQGATQLNNSFMDILGNFYKNQTFNLYGSHKIVATPENPFRIEVIIDGNTYTAIWPIDNVVTVGTAKNLINIDFTPTGLNNPSSKKGLGVVGFTNNDFWNSRGSGFNTGLYSGPQSVPLFNSDGTSSQVSNACLPFNAIFSGVNSFTDPMFNWSVLPQGGITIENLPSSTYDVYIYTYIGFPFAKSQITAQVNNEGFLYTDIASSNLITFYNDNIWREKVEYVLFRIPMPSNGPLGFGNSLTINSPLYLGGNGFINGIQLIQYGTGNNLISPTPSPSLPPPVNTAIANLINVNFGVTGNFQFKTGFAATGFTFTDLWNNRFTDLSSPLKYYDGTNSNVIGFHTSNNLINSGIFNHFDSMFSTYMFNNNFPNGVSTTFGGFDSGIYDIFVYGHGGTGNKNSQISMAVNINTNPSFSDSKQTSTENFSITTGQWLENIQYVRFNNIPLFNTDTLTLFWRGFINGAQFIKISGFGLTGSPASPPILPIVPSLNLNITNTTQDTISLQWTDIYSTESGFKIERTPIGGSFQEVTSVAKNTTTFTDTFLNINSTYNYRIRGFDTGNFGYSNTVTGTTQGSCYPILNGPSPSQIFPAGDSSNLLYIALGNVYVNISSNCSWTAFSDSDWLLLTNISSDFPDVPIFSTITGQGNGIVYWVMKKNSTFIPRTSKIFVNGNYIQFNQSNI